MCKAQVQVYLKSSQKFCYDIEAASMEELGSKAREHEYAIITRGFRHSGINEHTWYAPHWIDKIKVVGVDCSTSYRDEPTGT